MDVSPFTPSWPIRVSSRMRRSTPSAGATRSSAATPRPVRSRARGFDRRARPWSLRRPRHDAGIGDSPRRTARVFIVMGDGDINRGARVGGRHVRRQAQALQPYGHGRLQQDPVRRLHARHPGPRAAAGQMAGVRVPLQSKWTVTMSARCAHYSGLPSRRRKADGHHLPHREGQGRELCRGPRTGISKNKFAGRGTREDLREPETDIRGSAMRNTCLNMVYELAKQDERIIFIGSDLSPGLLSSIRRDMPDRYSWRALPSRTWWAWRPDPPWRAHPLREYHRHLHHPAGYEQVAVDLCLHDVPVR